MIVKNARLQTFDTPGSLGVVKDTVYQNCFWPKLDRPTALFAEGSSGITVQGPPTPRNVIFPKDTVFAKGTRGDCFFLRHKELISAKDEKPAHQEYVSELSVKEVEDFHSEKVDEEALRATKTFIAIHDSADKATPILLSDLKVQ